MLELHRNTGKNVEVSHKLSVIGTLIVASSFIVQCYMLKEKQLAKHWTLEMLIQLIFIEHPLCAQLGLWEECN